MSDWIKTTDKMPDNPRPYGFNNVIAYFGTDGGAVEEVMYNTKTRKFQYLDFDEVRIIPTHWMPLPEPPKDF